MHILRVLLIGHDYIRRIMEHLKSKVVDSFTVGSVQVKVDFVYSEGADYARYNESSYLEDWIMEFKPDIILVVLAGNGIKTNIPVPVYYDALRDFYNWLRGKFPGVIIISSECETRFHEENLGSDIPNKEEYDRRKVAVNQVLYKMKYKNYMMRFGRTFDNRSFFDLKGEYLNWDGNEKYWETIMHTIRYVMEMENMSRKLMVWSKLLGLNVFQLLMFRVDFMNKKKY